MLAKKWEYKYKNIKREDIDFVSEKFNIPKVISTIILNRNIPVSDIEAYLSKSKKNIVNPFELLDMDKAVERIIYAIDNNEILSSDDYYTGCYIIDTNVFVEKPDIIDSIPEDYFVVLSAKVLEELDHLKIKKNISVAGKKRANRALKNISDSLSRKDREIIMEDSDVRLLPKDFDKHNPDNNANVKYP